MVITRWLVHGDALAQALLSVALLTLLRDLLAVRYRRGWQATTAALPPISILKPVHGEEPAAQTAFRAWCCLDYPGEYEVIFALQDEQQPLYPLAAALAAEFGGRVRRVLSGTGLDPLVNGKSHNLAAAARVAKYDWLLISDSDTIPDDAVLLRFAAALQGRRIGAVSAIPRVTRASGLPARLERLLVNAVLGPYEYAASALHGQHGIWGTLLLVRREAVAAAGGFIALGRHLAEDIAFERALRRQGLRAAYVRVPIDVACAELDWRGLIGHWRRWLIGLRRMKPATYACLGLILLGWLLPIAVLASLWLLPGAATERGLALAVFAGAAAISLFALGLAGIGVREPTTSYLLLPVAVGVLLAAFFASMCGSTVAWRGQRLRVGRGGCLQPLAERGAAAPARWWQRLATWLWRPAARRR